jgi:hypothetical protein
MPARFPSSIILPISRCANIIVMISSHTQRNAVSHCQSRYFAPRNIHQVTHPVFPRSNAASALFILASALAAHNVWHASTMLA